MPKYSCGLILFNLFLGPRICSKMAGGHERRTKRRFDGSGANQDESDSSRTNVVNGSELRPRDRKRAATADIDDIMEESEQTSSGEDDVEDSPYRVEQRSGKAPADENSSEEEEETDGDDEEEEESEEREENLTYPILQRKACQTWLKKVC